MDRARGSFAAPGPSHSSSGSELYEEVTGQDRELDQLMDNTELGLSQMKNTSDTSDTFRSSREVSSLDEEGTERNNVFEAGRQVPSTSRTTARIMNREVLEDLDHSDNESGGGGGVGANNNVSSPRVPDPGLVEGASNADRSSRLSGRSRSPERRTRPVTRPRSSHSQRGGRKSVRAEMVVRDNEVILAIRGLDKLGVDPNNIKIVDSLDAEEEEEEEGSTDGLKKLKLVSLPSHEKNFMKEGIFAEKFRLPYTRQETTAILSWLESERQRGYPVNVKGTRIWKRMEDSEVCPGRSWQSLKQVWKKNLRRDSNSD